MALYMKSNILRVEKIIKKTKAKMFTNLKVGDRVEITVPIKGPGVNRGTYATFLTATNLQTGDTAKKSFNEITPILDCFDFVEEESR